METQVPRFPLGTTIIPLPEMNSRFALRTVVFQEFDKSIARENLGIRDL